MDHSPRKAAILSAVLPGAGQVYNKKTWKVPIIYAAFATCTYFALENRDLYIEYRDNYRNAIDNDSTTINEYEGLISNTGLRDLRNQHRQWMELNIILGGLTYILNIVDASVDAHLFHFDVSDNLSLRWQPDVRMNPITRTSFSGVKLTLTLGKKQQP